MTWNELRKLHPWLPEKSDGYHQHRFGGGWVSDDSEVSPDSYVCWDCVVTAASRVTDRSYVTGGSVVTGGSRIERSEIIHSWIEDSVVIGSWAEGSVVTDSAIGLRGIDSQTITGCRSDRPDR